MKAKILMIAVCLLSFVAAQAQEKTWKRSATMKEFKTAMKEKRYDAANQAINNATSQHAEAKADAQLYSMKTEAVAELITIENRKIYLNQKPDTAKYFNLIHELYQAGLQCDSLDAQSAKPKYRNAVAARLHAYRSKLVVAGKFFYNKKDYASAFRFFNLSITSKDAPIFTGRRLDESENIAALATLSAFGSGNHQGVMQYLTESLKDKALEGKLLEIGSKSAAALGDTLEMVNLLENGFYLYPDADYFFLTLVKHYNDHAQYAKALSKATRMAELHPSNRDYLFIKGKEEMLTHEWDSALVSFTRCTELKPDDVESFTSLGNIYLRKAHDLYADSSSSSKDELNKLYALAGENFEAARRFREDDPSVWFEGLREVYFKLNKGKELKALDRYMQ